MKEKDEKELLNWGKTRGASKEELESLKEELEIEREVDKIVMQNPIVQEQARLVRSWIAHYQLNLNDLTCPICGADYHKLKWICCDIDVEDSREHLHLELESGASPKAIGEIREYTEKNIKKTR